MIQSLTLPGRVFSPYTTQIFPFRLLASGSGRRARRSRHRVPTASADQEIPQDVENVIGPRPRDSVDRPGRHRQQQSHRRRGAGDRTVRPSEFVEDVNSVMFKKQEEFRKTLRRTLEMERRLRACQRTTPDQAKKTIEQALARMPYRTLVPPSMTPVTESDIQDDAELKGREIKDRTKSSPASLALAGAAEKLKTAQDTIHTNIVKAARLSSSSNVVNMPRIASAARQVSLGVADMFAAFQPAAPTYQDDFLVKSTPGQDAPDKKKDSIEFTGR